MAHPPFNFDYEFVFHGDFQQDVYDAYPIPDTDDTLEGIVKGIVAKLKYILQCQPGIHTISSFGVHDDQRIKITIVNDTWVAME